MTATPIHDGAATGIVTEMVTIAADIVHDPFDDPEQRPHSSRHAAASLPDSGVTTVATTMKMVAAQRQRPSAPQPRLTVPLRSPVLSSSARSTGLPACHRMQLARSNLSPQIQPLCRTPRSLRVPRALPAAPTELDVCASDISASGSRGEQLNHLPAGGVSSTWLQQCQYFLAYFLVYPVRCFLCFLYVSILIIAKYTTDPQPLTSTPSQPSPAASGVTSTPDCMRPTASNATVSRLASSCCPTAAATQATRPWAPRQRPWCRCSATPSCAPPQLPSWRTTEEHGARCTAWEAKLAEREANRSPPTEITAAVTESSANVHYVHAPAFSPGLAIGLDDPYHSLVAQVRDLEDQRVQDHCANIAIMAEYEQCIRTLQAKLDAFRSAAAETVAGAAHTATADAADATESAGEDGLELDSEDEAEPDDVLISLEDATPEGYEVAATPPTEA